MGNIRNKFILIISESGSLRTHEKDYQIIFWLSQCVLFAYIESFFSGGQTSEREDFIMFNVGEIGARLKGLREEKGMSQYELSVDMGITRESIAKYETGKRVTLDAIDTYSDYFNVNVDYILYGSGQKRNEDWKANKLLKMFECVPEEQKDMVFGMMTAMLKSVSK